MHRVASTTIRLVSPVNARRNVWSMNHSSSQLVTALPRPTSRPLLARCVQHRAPKNCIIRSRACDVIPLTPPLSTRPGAPTPTADTSATRVTPEFLCRNASLLPASPPGTPHPHLTTAAAVVDIITAAVAAGIIMGTLAAAAAAHMFMFTSKLAIRILTTPPLPRQPTPAD
jgi:hypothetical protein